MLCLRLSLNLDLNIFLPATWLSISKPLSISSSPPFSLSLSLSSPNPYRKKKKNSHHAQPLPLTSESQTPTTLLILTATTTILTLKLSQYIFNALFTKAQPKILRGPATTVLPFLTQEEKDKLPYPPDAYPGARDVDSPVRFSSLQFGLIFCACLPPHKAIFLSWDFYFMRWGEEYWDPVRSYVFGLWEVWGHRVWIRECKGHWASQINTWACYFLGKHQTFIFHFPFPFQNRMKFSLFPNGKQYWGRTPQRETNLSTRPYTCRLFYSIPFLSPRPTFPSIPVSPFGDQKCARVAQQADPRCFF